MAPMDTTQPHSDLDRLEALDPAEAPDAAEALAERLAAELDQPPDPPDPPDPPNRA